MRLNFLDKIPYDKYKHLVLGIILFVFLKYLLILLSLTNYIYIAFLAVCILGIAIEKYQSITRSGSYEKADMYATCGGAALGLICAI